MAVCGAVPGTMHWRAAAGAMIMHACMIEDPDIAIDPDPDIRRVRVRMRVHMYMYRTCTYTRTYIAIDTQLTDSD